MTICPLMSRPYIHKFNNSGFEEEEERMHEIGCYGEQCGAWSHERGCCGVKRFP